MPPIEAMVAVVIAGVIGWFVFRAFFAAGDRLQRVRTDPTQSAGRRRGAFWLLLVMFVQFVSVGSCLAINHENQIDCIKNYGHPC